MLDDTYLLVPPSEGKAPGGTGHWRPGAGSFRSLGPARTTVLDAFAAVAAGRTGDPAKVFGASGELLERAAAAMVAAAEGRGRALPAWQRYTGVVWEHLDPATLDDQARARLLIPTAALGLSAGTDPTPDHRGKLSVNLPGIGRLDRWWRSRTTQALLARAAGATIVDLLPQEHAAAIDLTALAARCRVVRVELIDRDGRAVGHAAKAAKGRFARHLLDHGLQGAAGFCAEGWTASVDGNRVQLLAPRPLLTP